MADSEKRLLRAELVKITRQLALNETTSQMAFDIIDWQASMGSVKLSGAGQTSLEMQSCIWNPHLEIKPQILIQIH